MVCHLSKVPSKELVNVNWDVVVDIHNKMCIRERERERERERFDHPNYLVWKALESIQEYTDTQVD
jgi:hypothetical protein